MTLQLAHHVRGRGPQILLLHAFPLDARMWDPMSHAIADECTVLMPDLRGFGASSSDDQAPAIDVMADDVIDLMDRLGLASVVLGGLSMGGYVALSVARRRPDLIDALVLMDTKASADLPAAAANRERIAVTLETSKTVDVLVDEVLPNLMSPVTFSERPEVVRFVTSIVRETPPTSAAWAQRAMAGRPDSFAALGALEVPALVVVGADDGVTPLAEAEAMQGALARVSLEVVPQAGHLSAVEQPEHVGRLVADFVRGV